MRKLVLFDLDGTLIDGRSEPLAMDRAKLFSKHAWICVQGVWVWIYVRPLVAEVLLAIRSMGPDVALSLYSAGSWDYVHEVLDKALIPAVLSHPNAARTPFYFDCIYTREDIDDRGVKRIDEALDHHDADSALLVDDLPEQCRYAETMFGEYSMCVKRFDAAEPGSENDRGLAAVLDHEMFRLVSCFSRETPQPNRRTVPLGPI
jgi:hypothetical protein